MVAKPWRGGLGTYVSRALIELLGHERVTLISTRPKTLTDKITRASSRAAWDTLLQRRITETPYDAAIFIQPPRILKALPNAQKHILWLVDDAKTATEFVPAMGHIFMSDPGYQEEVRRSIPASHFAGILPFAMLPSLHQPTASPRQHQNPMCFIANRDVKRSAWLSQVFAAGMRCHVYGNYFLQDPLWRAHPFSVRPSLTLGAMQHIYASHQLSLNIHASIVREGTNMRSFEAAGYGIPQVVEQRPGIEALFDPVEELPCFTSIEGLGELYERFLKDKNAAQKIAQKARTRVLAEHTYQHRVRTMLERIG